MASGTKFSPRTKHIELKYHHFRSHIKSGRVDIHYRPTDKQLANIFTKPLSKAFFVLRYMLCGWGYGSKPELIRFTGIHLSNTMVYFVQVFIFLFLELFSPAQ